jgi:maltose/moltooligosaccharide transporter
MNVFGEHGAAASGPKLFRTENLVYTKRGLLVLSFWLLWGDFAFNFFESIFGRFIPIYFKDLNASNTLIGIMTGSFAGLVNLFFLPGISRWSDNLRCTLGRRIPFLFVTTPLTVISLVLVGFAPGIGNWAHQKFLAFGTVPFGREAVVLALACVFVVSFHFFNMVLVNGYNWLIRDVVPLEVMARFLAWFRVVGTIGSACFLWFVFPYLLTHTKEILIGVGVFYLLAFWLMCWRVKEGAYPPPSENDLKVGVLKTFVVYFRECLQLPIYRNFFFMNLLVVSALACGGNFITLFARETLGLGMDEMGRIYSWTAVFTVIIYFPVGWACDRVPSLYVTLGSILAIALGALAALVWVKTATGFLVYSLLSAVPLVGFGLGAMSAMMKLFPSLKFGQFSAGLNVFGCGALIAGNFLIGLMMDLSNNHYRLAFLWTAVLSVAAALPMALVIRHWKKLGGEEHYVPPLPV